VLGLRENLGVMGAITYALRLKDYARLPQPSGLRPNTDAKSSAAIFAGLKVVIVVWRWSWRLADGTQDGERSRYFQKTLAADLGAFVFSLCFSAAGFGGEVTSAWIMALASWWQIGKRW